MGTKVRGPEAECGPTRCQTSHPDERLLEGFLRGESTRPENLRVVRHLLSGCPRCREKLLPLWGFLADEAFRVEEERRGPPGRTPGGPATDQREPEPPNESIIPPPSPQAAPGRRSWGTQTATVPVQEAPCGSVAVKLRW